MGWFLLIGILLTPLFFEISVDVEVETVVRDICEVPLDL